MKIAPSLNSLNSYTARDATSVASDACQVGVAESQAVEGRKLPLDPHRLRDVTFIGVGSSTAFLLNELNGRQDAHSDELPFWGKVTIIGEQDAWHPSVRGAGYINHQHEIIDQWGDRAPHFDPDYADRATFSAGNDAQIERAARLGAERINENITSVQRLDDGNYRIRLGSGNVVDSKQVVLGIGAGPHTSVWGDSDNKTRAEQSFSNITIALEHKAALRNEGRVLDLDEFMRAADAEPERFKGKTIAVHGPNAGIDAVERAGELGAKVEWLVRSTRPVLLDGNQLKYAPDSAKNALRKVDTLSISRNDDGRIALSCRAPGTDEATRFDADFYVYALGQDPDQPGAIGSVLGNALISQLEPMYDYDQVYSDKPYQTVLGLQSRGAMEGRGLLVVGASVAQLARQVSHTYLDHALERVSESVAQLDDDRFAQTLMVALLDGRPREEVVNQLSAMGGRGTPAFMQLETRLMDFFDARDYFSTRRASSGVAAEVENQVKTEVASVVVSPQLATVKASAGALSGMMPRYVANGEANYTSDNRTMLRAHIAERYPSIDNEQASKFIDEVIQLRHRRGSDFTQSALEEIKRLVSVGNASETIAALKEYGIGDELATRVQDLSGALENDANKDVLLDLKQALDEYFATRPKPVHGTPQAVRNAYEAALGRLDRGEQRSPLIKHWVRV
ncbi:hypothetical protein WK66_17335 [Burkholderia ubonensis]|nr:hypothetical protein [Burkholderia ubonensis]KVU44448.1 hypothetical protein WK66_17335 [Burkholderia ubonensis]